jgi:EAL domain-containing protein (putative c-di-GMP-specific phosphodiesterase class I)
VGRISVNASPAEFLRDDFAERCIARLHSYDIPPDLLEIELTEHVFLDQTAGYVARA